MDKWFLKSKTIWGAIIGILPNVAVMLGLEIPPGWVENLNQAGLSFIDTALQLFNAGNELAGLALVVYGRVKATQPITLKRKGSGANSSLMAALLAVFLVGCMGPMPYSEDREIALAQKWAQDCGQMGQVIQTAIVLYQAGHLTQEEARVIDRVDQVFRPICTGTPGPLDQVLTDAGVKMAVSELCPEITLGMADNAVITLSQAAACAARKALLLQLEVPQS